MPLTEHQARLARPLSENRAPDSDLAGGAALKVWVAARVAELPHLMVFGSEDDLA